VGNHSMKSTQKISSGPNRPQGFTLVELMVVIGIIALGLAIGIPTYNLTIKPTARLNGAARQLYSDIQLARLQAVSENGRCGLAFSAGPTYTVFRDNNPANSQYDAGNEQVIKSVNLANEYPNVQFDTSQGGGDGISFADNSFSMTPRGLATIQGTVYLINEKGEGRSIVVNNMGSVRLEKY
jgi:prepilin-type N-terminal cleavage/methylation domain-containing protein